MTVLLAFVVTPLVEEPRTRLAVVLGAVIASAIGWTCSRGARAAVA